MLWLQRLRSARPSSGEVRGHQRGPEGECELPGVRAEVIIILRVQWHGHGGQVEADHLSGEHCGDRPGPGREHRQDEQGKVYPGFIYTISSRPFFQKGLSQTFIAETHLCCYCRDSHRHHLSQSRTSLQWLINQTKQWARRYIKGDDGDATI